MIEAPPAKTDREPYASDPVPPEPPTGEESGDDILSLLSALASDASLWLHQETELAKAEFGQKLKLISNNAIKLLISALVLGAGASVLLLALVVGLGITLQLLGLEAITAFGLAALVTGGALFITGIILFRKSKNILLASELLPRRAAERLQETKNWALEKIK